MSDNTLRHCSNAHCRHPHGRWQPIANFRGDNGRLYKGCADCRRYFTIRRNRTRERGTLPSNAPDAEYRRGLAGWLLGLVHRRQGPQRKFD